MGCVFPQSDRQRRPTSRRTACRLLTGVLVAVPGMALAQGTTPVRRIGRLESGARETPDEISDELRKLGWMEGRNLHIERRYADNRFEALQPLADELVRAKVEVIVTGGTPATLAAKRATTTIPIVFRAAGDPVGTGLVASLARPGGNVTGFSLSGPDLVPKYLSVLKELLPGLRRVGVLEASTNPYFRATRAQFERACRAQGLEPLFVEISAAGEIEGAIAQLARQRPQALVLRTDSLIYDHRLETVNAAMNHRLPTMAEAPFLVRDAGALISYANTDAEESSRAARYVDRILRGAKPADIPVEQSTTFELVINLKTARALGLTIPQALLLRADEVIK